MSSTPRSARRVATTPSNAEPHDDTEHWAQLAKNMEAEQTLVQETTKGLVEETLSSLRKLADNLDDGRWMYDGQGARREEVHF